MTFTITIKSFGRKDKISKQIARNLSVALWRLFKDDYTLLNDKGKRIIFDSHAGAGSLEQAIVVDKPS